MQSSSSRNIAGHQNNGTKCLLQLKIAGVEFMGQVHWVGEESNTCAVLGTVLTAKTRLDS